MGLNLILLAVASLFVGFVLGWIVGRPRRWDYFAREDSENGFAGGGQG